MPAPRIPTLAVIARVLLVPYAIAMALIVWLPASIAGRVTGIAFRLARYASEYFGIALSTSYTVFEFLANIALFIPFGLLLAAAWPRTNPWIVILIGYATSATIELVQTLLPSRYPTLSDVVANSLGAIIGCVVARLFLRLSPTHRRFRASTVEA